MTHFDKSRYLSLLQQKYLSDNSTVPGVLLLKWYSWLFISFVYLHRHSCLAT